MVDVVTPTLTSANVQGNPDQIARDFFVYEADITGLAPGTTDTTSFLIQADSAFVWQKSMIFPDIAGAAQTLGTIVLPLVTIQITDTGSGRNLFNTPIPVCSLFGNPSLAEPLPLPKQFAPNATVSLALTNFSAATTYNLRFSFIGQKLFYR